MARTDNLEHYLKDVADSLRTRGETTEPINANEFDNTIADLPSNLPMEEYMRMFDLVYIQTHPQRPYSEGDYTQSEVDKVDELLIKLKGDDSNG